jgi:glycosyltransferase involved in cell wall biosynthesis
MAGISVPSRLYNMLSAGKPILALADADSEVAHVINEVNIGLVIPPDNIPAFRQAILGLAAHPNRRKEMGQRARKAAESKYQFETILNAYCDVMRVGLEDQNAIHSTLDNPKAKRTA